MRLRDLFRNIPPDLAPPPPPKTAPGVTFAVSEVSPGTRPLSETAYVTAVECQLAPPPSGLPPEVRRALLEQEPDVLRTEPKGERAVEACSRYRGRLLADVYSHPFVMAVHLAFAHHRPLVISPDMVWLLIAQGFAAHVSLNAEALRSRLVRHAGKVQLTVRRHDFIRGSPENPWEEVFGSFSAGIREQIGPETHDLLLPRFSTTDAVSRAAAEVVLLQTMQRYFDFALVTYCGIPSITLEGEPADWRQILERLRALASFGLESWAGTLDVILEEFVAASEGRARPAFWRSLYKDNDWSGGPYVTGWLSAFFPYLADPETGLPSTPNELLGRREWAPWDESVPELTHLQAMKVGPTFEQLPSGLSRVPFQWRYYLRSYRMEFLAGFVGVGQRGADLALRPEIGWAVREAGVG